MLYELHIWELGFGWRYESTFSWKKVIAEAEKFIARGYKIRIEAKEKERWE